MRRVGEILAFDSHAVVVVVAASGLVCGASCEPVSGVDLYAGLVGVDGETSSGIVVRKDCYSLDVTGLPAVDSPAVVIAFAVYKNGVWLR